MVLSCLPEPPFASDRDQRIQSSKHNLLDQQLGVVWLLLDDQDTLTRTAIHCFDTFLKFPEQQPCPYAFPQIHRVPMQLSAKGYPIEVKSSLNFPGKYECNRRRA